MKKIAFMFVAAALFAACGEKKAPAQEAEVAEVEEAVVEIADSLVWAEVGDTTGLDSAAVAEKFAAVKDSLTKAATPAEEAAAPAEEEAAAPAEEAAAE